ncbi:MAG TPA: VCBS repeat-containing protein, partial [Pyrinomonadaceae bacterium]|nr:VCBS repeat-containing protein [Pyrinomonadaceae bacterium]
MRRDKAEFKQDGQDGQDKREAIALLLILSILSILLINPRRIVAQQQTPAPAPQRTGRSYSGAEPGKTPPPPGPQAPSTVTFTDISAQTGISFKHAASATSQKYLLEAMGGGVCMFDYDADGRLDLYFSNGARIEDPMRKGAMPDKKEPRYWNRLYHQKGDGTFEDVTERAGVAGAGYSMGVAAA